MKIRKCLSVETTPQVALQVNCKGYLGLHSLRSKQDITLFKYLLGGLFSFSVCFHVRL